MLKDNLKETNNHNEWNNEKKDLLQKVDDLTSALSVRIIYINMYMMKLNSILIKINL